MVATCIDCGLEYKSMGLDLVLPDQQWKIVCPEDGILCANCICKRSAKLGGTVILSWIDNLDYSKTLDLEKPVGELISFIKSPTQTYVPQGWQCPICGVVYS